MRDVGPIPGMRNQCQMPDVTPKSPGILHVSFVMLMESCAHVGGFESPTCTTSISHMVAPYTSCQAHISVKLASWPALIHLWNVKNPGLIRGELLNKASCDCKDPCFEGIGVLAMSKHAHKPRLKPK